MQVKKISPRVSTGLSIRAALNTPKSAVSGDDGFGKAASPNRWVDQNGVLSLESFNTNFPFDKITRKEENEAIKKINFILIKK